MDIQDQYLDIQQCDKDLIYSVLMSKYSAVIPKIFILTCFNKQKENKTNTFSSMMRM